MYHQEFDFDYKLFGYGAGRLAGNVVMSGKVLVNGKSKRLEFGASVSKYFLFTQSNSYSCPKT